MTITKRVELASQHPLIMCNGCIHRPKQFCASPCSKCEVTIETPTNFQSDCEKETGDKK